MQLRAVVRRRQDYVPPSRDEGPGGAKIATSTAWSTLGIGATSILQIVRSMIFARLLMPEDFGILSLANVFTQFILIFANFGFNQSIIYHKKLDRQDLTTCWWSNLGVDSTMALICVVFALVSTRFSDDPTVARVVCLLAIQFVITSLGSVNNALLRRRFMFKHTAIASLAGAVTSFAVAWYLVAVPGWGVYGLVSGMIAGNLVITVLNFTFMPWLPSFSFSREALGRHFRYGRWMLGVSLVTYANGNADRATVGTLLSKVQLGFYEYASNIPLMLIDMLARVLNSVLFSAFSSLQEKPEEFIRLLVRVYRYNSMLVFPVLTGIALVAPDFISVAYGERWAPILVPLRLFCVVGILQMYTRPLYILCNSLGKPNLPFKWSLIYLPINLALLFVGMKMAGTTGVVAARIAMPVFMMLTLGVQIMGVIGVSWLIIFRATLPALTGSTLMGVVLGGWSALGAPMPDATLPRLLLQISIGAGTYILFMGLFFRNELTGVMSFLRQRS